MKDNILLKSLFTSVLTLGLVVQPGFAMDDNMVPVLTEKHTPTVKTMERIFGERSKLQNELIKINSSSNFFPEDQKIDLTLRDMNISSVMRILAKEGQMNIVLDESVQGTISAELKHISLNEAMNIILISEELEARLEGNTIFIASRPVIAKKGLNRKYVKAFKLNNSNAVDIAKILEASIFNKGYKVNETAVATGTAMQATTAPGSSGMASTGQSELISKKTIRGRVEKLNSGEKFADASELASEIKLQSVTSEVKTLAVDNNDGGAIVIPDTRTNSILIAGLEEDILLAEESIKYLDKALPQVSIEVSLIELAKEDYDNLGFSMFGHTNDSTNGFNMPVTNPLGYANTTELAFDSINSMADNLSFRIKALLQSKKAKLLANPKITALDGSESLIKITDRIISKMDITVTQTNITYNPTLEDIGIVLNILPKVGDNGYITMRVRPSITTSLGKEDIGSYGAFATLIQTREVILQDTRVKSGETLAIGGLVKETETETVGKVPVLSSLPFIGGAFKNTEKKKTNTELVILITPKLIDENQLVYK